MFDKKTGILFIVFRKLKKIFNILQPSQLILNFERGLINAVRLEFEWASIKRCLFHFGQAIYGREFKAWALY